MPRVGDASTVLAEACASAQATFQRVTELEHLADGTPDELQQALTESPIQPFWIDESDALLFYSLTKVACVVGFARGSGFLIHRLPSDHPTLVKWSAPCFVTISLASLGLSLGFQRVRSFTACMRSHTRLALYQRGGRPVAGLEASLRCGGLQHKADIIAVPAKSDVKTVGINHVSGPLLDLSACAGTLSVDAAKNATVYGPGVAPLQILHGTVEPPREMQPLYATLNAVVNTVERISPGDIARTSASLERHTAGFDPERRMVIQTRAGGLIVEGEAPPHLGGSSGGSSGGGGGGAEAKKLL